MLMTLKRKIFYKKPQLTKNKNQNNEQNTRLTRWD